MPNKISQLNLTAHTVHIASELKRERCRVDAPQHHISSHLLHHLRSFFSDPDLKIEVDLAREEEEKNGRREYSIFPLHTEPMILARFRVKRTLSARGIHAT